MSVRSIRTLLVAGAVALTAAAPASAALISDAFTSFNGTQGAGGFFYGQNNGPTVGFQGYTANTNCFISGSTCLQQSANFDVPGVTKSTATSFQYGTVNVPNDRLLLHPDQAGNAVNVLYQAPTAGTYIIRGTANVQDVAPTGVNVGYVFAPGGAVSNTAIGTIGAGNPSVSFSRKIFANAGDFVGFTFDNAGNYFNDSTGFNFSVSGVPEPTTWAMMIGGVGLVGGSLRRRRGMTLATA